MMRVSTQFRRLIASGGLMLSLLLTGQHASADAAETPPFPAPLTEFERFSDDAVFVAGEAGAWDEQIRERAWIMRDGDAYRMWYSGYMPDGVLRLGHATSPDGIHWKRDPHNPIYGAHWIEDVHVVKHEGVYYLFAEGMDDIAHLFISPDGLAWKRQGALDIRTASGQPIPAGPRGTPVAWHDVDYWYLMYERDDKSVWLARSEDMQVWVNVTDKPVILPEMFGDLLIAPNQVIKVGNYYYLYYHAKSKKSGRWSIDLAASSDLVHWVAYEGNPLLPESLNLTSGFIVNDGRHNRLYTTHRQVDLFVNP